MADDATTQTGTQGDGLTIPADVLVKFKDYIDLIKASESMNTEERQYWINILPIMTPDQLQNLKDILVNEKDQLAAIDAKYQTEIDRLGQTEAAKKMEEDRRKKREERTSTEEAHKAEEEKAAEDLFKQMGDTGK